MDFVTVSDQMSNQAYMQTDSLEMVSEPIIKPVPIEGYSDKYKVSNDGVVYTSNGEVLKLHTDGYNRLQVTMWNGGKRKVIALHRLLALAFIPNPNGYSMVAHKDGNLLNNKLSNLEWGKNNVDYSSTSFPITLCNLNTLEEKTFPSINQCGTYLAEVYNSSPSSVTTILSEKLKKQKPFGVYKDYRVNYTNQVLSPYDKSFNFNDYKTIVQSAEELGVTECVLRSRLHDGVANINLREVCGVKYISMQDIERLKGTSIEYRGNFDVAPTSINQQSSRNFKTRGITVINTKNNESIVFYSMIEASNYLSRVYNIEKATTVQQSLSRLIRNGRDTYKDFRIVPQKEIRNRAEVVKQMGKGTKRGMTMEMGVVQ